MPTHEAARQHGARRARHLLVRAGTDLYTARTTAALSLREVGRAAGISHTQVRRVERAEAPHVDVRVLARLAAAIGAELSLGIHPIGPPVRDAAHLALLGRLRARLAPGIDWRTEVPMPIPGDRRAADATFRLGDVHVMVEAETRLGDIQALERRIATKARDLGCDRIVLLVLESRHDRAVVREVPGLRERFPVGTRAALAALGRGVDPGGNCLIVL